jgi:ATP-dependent helicase/nuclease subunit A
VTGLVDYSICPQRFKFRYVDGHPGIGEGASANARLIGTLTHTALEQGIFSTNELRPFADGAADEILEQAVELAAAFRDGESFHSFKLGDFEREVSISFELDGTVLAGKADLVGGDFVLDFKTDRLDVPTDHAIQLWVYAKALNKPRAYVAYLRQQKLHEYSVEELAKAECSAVAAVAGVASANFKSTPSEKVCGACSYRSICHERH